MSDEATAAPPPERHRRHFYMTREQWEELRQSCKPSRSIYDPPGNPGWQTIGDELGFHWETVSRSGNGNTRFFTAVAIDGWQPPR